LVAFHHPGTMMSIHFDMDHLKLLPQQDHRGLNWGRAWVDFRFQLLLVETCIKIILFHISLSDSQLSKSNTTCNRYCRDHIE